MTNTHCFFNAQQKFTPENRGLLGVYLLIHKKFVEIPEEDLESKLRLIREVPIDVITALANYDPKFASYCNHDNLKLHWRNLWYAAGRGLAIHLDATYEGFFEHPNLNQFNLVRGIHYFYQSQLKRKEIKEINKSDFSASEKRLLQIAISYGSIHAIQRYNDYLYADLKNANFAETKALYKELNDNSKKSINPGGSYGYMIYAESLMNYCVWLLANSNIQEAKKVYDAVLLSLEHAQNQLAESKFSISNASLGRGLRMSNSWGIDSPKEAKRLFIQQFTLLVAPARLQHAATPCEEVATEEEEGEEEALRAQCAIPC